MLYLLVFDKRVGMLFGQFEGTFVGPEGVDAHGAPGFFVDVVEGDGLAVVRGSLSGCSCAFGRVGFGYKVRASSASCGSECAVFLDELENDNTFVQGSF